MTISRLLGVALVLVPSVARAEEAQAPAPHFLHLGADGRASELGLDLGFIRSTDGGDGTFVRGVLAGQGVDPRSGFGGYGVVAFGSFSDDGESETALGGLEVGGLYRYRANPEVDVTFRAGVVLPTVSEDDGLVYVYATLLQQPGDLATIAVEDPAARLAVTPTYHRDRVYARADVGFDLVGDTEADPYVHAHGAVGFAPQPVGGAVELQNLCTTESDVDDQCIHLIGASLQVGAGRGVGALGISMPFGDDDLDVLNIELGFRGRF